MTEFVRKSILSGKIHKMEIPITEDDFNAYLHSNQNIQDYFPQLTAEQREFLRTGITQEEWDAATAEEDDELDPPEHTQGEGRA